MDTKICTKCLEEKEISQFNIKNRNTGRLEARCKTCFNEYTKAHYVKNKEYYLAKARYHEQDHLKITREFLKQKKDVPCKDCAIRYPSFVMDFDHVTGKKVLDVSKMTSYTMERIVAEIEKCEVVCSNCHRFRTNARKEKRSKISAEKPISLKKINGTI